MSNLIYAFIDSNFNSNDSIKRNYSYDTLPDYYIKTIERNSAFFDKSYFILQNHIIENIKSKISSNIHLVSLEEEVLKTDEYQIVEELLKTLWPHYKAEVFLYHAFLRLIFVSIFVEKLKEDNIIHLEADNTVYYSGEEIFKSNVIGSGEFGYGLVSPLVGAPGIICFKDSASGRNLLTRIVKMLMAGEQEVLAAIGFNIEYLTDMNFLDVISRGSKYFKLLPSLPFTELSKNYDKFKFLFDPASYGQFLGGTNNGHDKGYFESNHYIGRMIASDKIKVIYDKLPFAIYQEEKYPIYNLHIHNKKVINDFL